MWPSTIGELSHREKKLTQECTSSVSLDVAVDNRRRDVPDQQQGRYFCYDAPLYEETGIWIPVSVPPMSESDHDEWRRGFGSNGGFFPEGDMGWNQFVGEDKELTMWDVVLEMLLAAQGKVTALANGELQSCRMSWLSGHLLEQAWKEMAQTLTEANFGNMKEILDSKPPKWLPDSASSSCMLCSVRFHPIMCSRHHCRFCGGIFCSECSKGRSLLPVNFRTGDPQRVCDVCCVKLEPVQKCLMDQVSRASQLPTHDLTDLSTLRSWINFPWGQSMEYEIYKATNTIKGYNKVYYSCASIVCSHHVLIHNALSTAHPIIYSFYFILMRDKFSRQGSVTTHEKLRMHCQLNVVLSCKLHLLMLSPTNK